MAEQSGYTRLLEEKNRGPLLTLIGVVLIAFSMGNLEIGNSIKFVPLQNISERALYIATGLGAMLVLTGIFLILYQKRILQSLLRILLYVLITVALLAVGGVIVGMQFFPKEKPDLIQCYTVNPSSLRVYVSFWKIREYTRSYQHKTLLVVYRKVQSATLFEEDPYIAIRQFTIGRKDTEMLMIPFSTPFSKTLRAEKDMVEFALWLCPNEIDLAKVRTSLDLEKQGGELLETASATVQSELRWSGRYCPQFFRNTAANAVCPGGTEASFTTPYVSGGLIIF